jgi:hypothetical protein
MQRSRGARVTFRSCRSLAGRYPAFMTVHLRTSGGGPSNL